MLARPRCPANAAPLASNARPMPALFVLRAPVGRQVAEGCAEAVDNQVAGVYALAAAGAQVAEVCVLAEVVGAQGVAGALAEEAGADDRKTQQFY